MEKALKGYWPIFVLPTLCAFLIGFVYPFFQGVYLSFCKFISLKKIEFVGWNNYSYVFTDKSFFHAFMYTLAFAIVSVILINAIALAIAVVLTADITGSDAFRTVFFMPNLIGGIVLGYIWKTILDCVLTLIEQPLLALNEKWGFVGLIILMCWQQIGYMMIIYIAGLNSIDKSYVEAAMIDGATKAQILFNIKIPNIMSSITICMFLTLTNGFKLFDQNLALTGGEPAHASEMLALNIYHTFYAREGAQWKGYGQAKAVVFCVLVLAISLIQLKMTKSKEVQA